MIYKLLNLITFNYVQRLGEFQRLISSWLALMDYNKVVSLINFLNVLIKHIWIFYALKDLIFRNPCQKIIPKLINSSKSLAPKNLHPKVDPIQNSN